MQRNPLLLTLLSLRAYSWFWSLSGTRDTHLLPPVLMLKMSAYQVFSDTQLPTPTCIIKMLCGGFPLARRQWGANVHGWVAFPVAFMSFRQIITNHQGQQFMQSRSVEFNTLTGYTLAVDNNETVQNDAQWIAIGY